MNEQEKAIEFVSSVRGQYIISQALWMAIEKLNEVPENRREDSNISDMEFLLDNIFPMFKVVQAAQQGTLGTSPAPVDVIEAEIASLNDEANGVYQECEECGGNLYRCNCLQENIQ